MPGISIHTGSATLRTTQESNIFKTMAHPGLTENRTRRNGSNSKKGIVWIIMLTGRTQNGRLRVSAQQTSKLFLTVNHCLAQALCQIGCETERTRAEEEQWWLLITSTITFVCAAVSLLMTVLGLTDVHTLLGCSQEITFEAETSQALLSKTLEALKNISTEESLLLNGLGFGFMNQNVNKMKQLCGVWRVPL